MKYTQFFIVFLACLLTGQAQSQLDSINQLDEVVLSDVRLQRNSIGQQVWSLNDSVLLQNEPSLTSLLKFNSPIYFRENGYGMVSSASFRGTTASQTAVVWNGININSQFNGQTDFNTVTTGTFNNISVRAGGGSVLYGSGAIGGTVHLNNRFSFGQGFGNLLRAEYGSFNTFSGVYKSQYSSDDTSVQLSLTRNSSDNNFEYPGTGKYNSNGDFYNTGVSAGIAHILNQKNTFRFYTSYSGGERAFSGTLTAPSRSKYVDENSRNMLEWKAFYNSITSSLKLAYLDEHYKYYENRHRETYSYGRAKTGIAKYDIRYHLNEDISLNAILDYRHIDGEGSDVGNHKRNIGAAALLLSHDLGRIAYEVSGRKEVTENYESPFLFSISAAYEVTEFYHLKLNASKNFRIPTYNDLFWRTGGNLDLKPEESHQAEIGQNLLFKHLELGITAYVVRISDLLRWVPDASGLWRPVNTEDVTNYGLEATAAADYTDGAHRFDLHSTYAYTKSRDNRLDRELIYVPKHKATASLAYAVGSFSAYYQYLYNGDVFTSSDNKYVLDGYNISNVGLNFSFFSKNRLTIGAEVRNLFDTYYLSQPSRPMPGRSFNSSVTFNF